jgi:hypothetical protein
MNLGQAKNLLKNPDFMKWFRKSPVKDESGVPSRVFHGSGTSFDEFKTNDITKAMFFADMPSMANSFNKGTGKGFTEKLKNGHVIWAKEGSQTYPVYLSMQNPKIIDVEKIKNFHNTDFAKEKIISQAKKDGHDGVIFQNIRDYGDYRFGEGISGNVYAVFNPTQIKSQFNKGTFDPTNPNILKTATAIATGATALGVMAPEESEAGVKDVPKVLKGLTHEAKNIQKKLLSHFGTTQNPKEAGYILNDGSMLDLSGRHYASGYVNKKQIAGEPDYLRGKRNVDHRELPEELDFTEVQSKGNVLRFSDINGDLNVQLTKGQNITNNQWNTLSKIKQREKGKIYYDISDLSKDATLSSGEAKSIEHLKNISKKYLPVATIATGATAMLSKDALAAKHKQMAEKQALQDAYSPVDMVIAGATGGTTMGLRAISALADPVINYAIDRMLGD